MRCILNFNLLFDLLVTADKIKSNETYDNTPNENFHSQNRNTKDVIPSAHLCRFWEYNFGQSLWNSMWMALGTHWGTQWELDGNNLWKHCNVIWTHWELDGNTLGTHWEQEEPTPLCPPLRQEKKKFQPRGQSRIFLLPPSRSVFT